MIPDFICLLKLYKNLFLYLQKNVDKNLFFDYCKERHTWKYIFLEVIHLNKSSVLVHTKTALSVF
jgi:hypothetical protein